MILSAGLKVNLTTEVFRLKTEGFKHLKRPDQTVQPFSETSRSHAKAIMLPRQPIQMSEALIDHALKTASTFYLQSIHLSNSIHPVETLN